MTKYTIVETFHARPATRRLITKKSFELAKREIPFKISKRRGMRTHRPIYQLEVPEDHVHDARVVLSEVRDDDHD